MNLISRLFGAPVQELQPDQLQARLRENKKPILLDVRQPDEYRQGHIQGAVLAPLGELRSRMGELPKDREIICICRSGSRSSDATRQLSQAGFKAQNLQGGMLAWTRAGLPVKRGGSQ
jgi:rhodanese-related sulfurtransferase